MRAYPASQDAGAAGGGSGSIEECGHRAGADRASIGCPGGVGDFPGQGRVVDAESPEVWPLEPGENLPHDVVVGAECSSLGFGQLLILGGRNRIVVMANELDDPAFAGGYFLAIEGMERRLDVVGDGLGVVEPGCGDIGSVDRLDPVDMDAKLVQFFDIIGIADRDDIRRRDPAGAR